MNNTVNKYIEDSIERYNNTKFVPLKNARIQIRDFWKKEMEGLVKLILEEIKEYDKEIGYFDYIGLARDINRYLDTLTIKE